MINARLPIQHLAPTRNAFTLLELLLVLVILVIVFALAVPALRHPLANQRLRKAADVVRAEFGRAKLDAIKTGATIAFQIQSETRNCRIIPWTLNPDDNSDSTALQNQFNAMSRSMQLPVGVKFVELTTDDDRTAFAYQQQATQTSTEHDGVDWSTPIMFFPDGTSSGAKVVIKNRFESKTTLKLRWLTAIAEIESTTHTEDTSSAGLNTGGSNGGGLSNSGNSAIGGTP